LLQPRLIRHIDRAGGSSWELAMIAGRISISVILPNYNHAEELKTSLPAVLAQHLPPDEIVIIDDASVDHSISVIREFMAASPAIRLVRHERRLGVAAAVNRGLAEAQSDFVILTAPTRKSRRK
jgi:succinoglycan biosynthesis protein ExoO